MLLSRTDQTERTETAPDDPRPAEPNEPSEASNVPAPEGTERTSEVSFFPGGPANLALGRTSEPNESQAADKPSAGRPRARERGKGRSQRTLERRSPQSQQFRYELGVLLRPPGARSEQANLAARAEGQLFIGTFSGLPLYFKSHTGSVYDFGRLIGDGGRRFRRVKLCAGAHLSRWAQTTAFPRPSPGRHEFSLRVRTPFGATRRHMVHSGVIPKRSFPGIGGG